MERTGLRMYPSIHHCAFCSRSCNSSVDQRKTLRMSVAPASRVYPIPCYLNDMRVCVCARACMNDTVEPRPSLHCFVHLLTPGAPPLICFCLVSFHRVRQKPITKGTAMPGESKASRPPRVVLRRGTSLTPCPPPPPRLRAEPLAPHQTVSPAKAVRRGEH